MNKRNIFMIFEGSYQIDRIETDAPILPHFAQYRLAKCMEYRKSDNYWASISIGAVENRYKIKDNEFINTHTFNLDKN